MSTDRAFALRPSHSTTRVAAIECSVSTKVIEFPNQPPGGLNGEGGPPNGRSPGAGDPALMVTFPS